MFAVTCHELGIDDCDHRVVAVSLRRLESGAFAHFRDRHPELIAGATGEERRGLLRRIAARAREIPEDGRGAA